MADAFGYKEGSVSSYIDSLLKCVPPADNAIIAYYASFRTFRASVDVHFTFICPVIREHMKCCVFKSQTQIYWVSTKNASYQDSRNSSIIIPIGILFLKLYQ